MEKGEDNQNVRKDNTNLAVFNKVHQLACKTRNVLKK
jgi:hypothetical protein